MISVGTDLKSTGRRLVHFQLGDLHEIALEDARRAGRGAHEVLQQGPAQDEPHDPDHRLAGQLDHTSAPSPIYSLLNVSIDIAYHSHRASEIIYIA